MSLIDEILKVAADKALVHERVDESEKQRRLSICEGCPMFEPNHRKCTVCGCYMDVKAGAKTNFNPQKGRNEITHCPKGFWGDLQISKIILQYDSELIKQNGTKRG